MPPFCCWNAWPVMFNLIVGISFPEWCLRSLRRRCAAVNDDITPCEAFIASIWEAACLIRPAWNLTAESLMMSHLLALFIFGPRKSVWRGRHHRLLWWLTGAIYRHELWRGEMKESRHSLFNAPKLRYAAETMSYRFNTRRNLRAYVKREAVTYHYFPELAIYAWNRYEAATTLIIIGTVKHACHNAWALTRSRE